MDKIKTTPKLPRIKTRMKSETFLSTDHCCGPNMTFKTLIIVRQADRLSEFLVWVFEGMSATIAEQIVFEAYASHRGLLGLNGT